MNFYTTNALGAVARTLYEPPTFFLDTFFPTVQQETAEEISFDIEVSKRRLSPFVHPLTPGKVVDDPGIETKTLKPAYIKDVRMLVPSEALKRSAGEALGGSLSPSAREALLIQQKMQDQRTMLKRRMEVMAALTMLNASLTITGENYPATVVNYGRKGGHTVSLTLGSRWSQSTADPEQDLEDQEQKLLQETGAGAKIVVMENKAWQLFRANEKVKDRLERRRVNQTDMTMTLSQKKEGAMYMGSLGAFDIYTYRGWYVNDAGAEVQIMPDYTVIVGGDAYEGVRAFGAIRDLDSLQAVEAFWKSEKVFDPSAHKILMQSAPLTYPRFPNASVTMTVHS